MLKSKTNTRRRFKSFCLSNNHRHFEDDKIRHRRPKNLPVLLSPRNREGINKICFQITQFTRLILNSFSYNSLHLDCKLEMHAAVIEVVIHSIEGKESARKQRGSSHYKASPLCIDSRDAANNSDQ